MSIRIPEGLADADDAAVTSLREGCEFHRMVRDDTVHTECGLPEYALVHPFPSVGYAALLARSLCERCWPQSSVWQHLVELAYPSRFRTADVQGRRGFGAINSARLAGHPLDGRSR